MPHVKPEPSPTLVDVSDLIDRPGASRPVELDVPVPEGFAIPLTTFGEVILLDGRLESLIDGVLVRGKVAVEVVQTCARCLEPLDPGEVVADIAELYSDPKSAEAEGDIEEGYEIRGGLIDIDALLRDTLAMATTDAPRCSDTCAGLCPTCGINRNAATCECADEGVDGRWAALSDLKLNP